jgi:hypothetical protein
MAIVSASKQVLQTTCLDFQVNETAVIRWDFGDPQLGTCKETIDGGAHFRYWTQDGNSADR